MTRRVPLALLKTLALVVLAASGTFFFGSSKVRPLFGLSVEAGPGRLGRRLLARVSQLEVVGPGAYSSFYEGRGLCGRA